MVINLNELKYLALPIIKLDEASINRIAAGEVVERPAAAVKELIENAIDAGAGSIQVSFSHGGKSIIKVTDDGFGIRKEELKLALTSHATSKMHHNDLSNIQTLGFRGEALPSLAAISKLTLKSRTDEDLEGSMITVKAGKIEEIKPCALSSGTIVEIEDLFYSTPARLKFLKTDRAETQAIFDVVKRLALSKPDIKFQLQDITKKQKKIYLDLPKNNLENKYFNRIQNVLGANFSENCIQLDLEKDGYSVSGFTSIPTNSMATLANQYFFVNGRSVKDRQLFAALRAAYFDFVAKDRFPAAVIYVNCDLSLVDINVHPMKSEVRFKFPKDVRSIIINAIKNTLSQNGMMSNRMITAKTLGSFSSHLPPKFSSSWTNKDHAANDPPSSQKSHQLNLHDDSSWFSANVESDPEGELILNKSLPLGVAKAQLHENFIVSQSKDGLFLIDQHAAHERIIYEKLKSQFQTNRVESQDLLIPEIIDLLGNEKDIILEYHDVLSNIGFVVEAFGEKSVCVRGVPALLGLTDLKGLISDLVDELLISGKFDSLERRVDAIISRISCHGSVRSGRRMNSQEMNKLLRQMESTPFSAQCNHGRPTFVELKLTDIEKLFGRT